LDNARGNIGSTENTQLKVRPQIKGKTNMKTIPMLIIIALLLGAVSAYVHAETQPLLKASIPFSFIVGNQSFPAGDYTISTVQVQARDVILLQSSDGQRASFAPTHPSYLAGPSAQTKLIFQHYGSEYFLSQIWTQGISNGRELVLPDHAKEPAPNASTSEVTTILASAKF
jgi:hypothetical protein